MTKLETQMLKALKDAVDHLEDCPHLNCVRCENISNTLNKVEAAIKAARIEGKPFYERAFHLIPEKTLNFLIREKIAGYCDGCGELRLWEELEETEGLPFSGFAVCQPCMTEGEEIALKEAEEEETT